MTLQKVNVADHIMAEDKAMLVCRKIYLITTHALTHCMLGHFFWFCCRLLTILNINFFKQFFQEFYHCVKRCQTVWIQIRTDITSALIWVQTICKGYQQMLTWKELIKCTPKRLWCFLNISNIEVPFSISAV